MTNKLLTHKNQAGVILLETLISILIFSIGLLALVGVQAVMVSNTSDAKYRSEAAFIAQKRIAELWANPDKLDLMGETDTDISSVLPQGKRSTVQVAVGEFIVTVTWQPPGDSADPVVHQHVAIARIVGGA